MTDKSKDIVTLLVYGYIRRIQSDIPKDVIEVCLSLYKMIKGKQIELKVHSHKGDQNDPPENMLDLSENSRPYYSKHGTCKDDWIIFEPSNNRLFYVPTRVELKVRQNGDQAINEFNILYGNAAEDEWMKCHSHTFKTANIEEIQSFDLDLASNIFASFKSKRYQQYKLEILTNRGSSDYVEAQQFKMFGVEV